MTSMCPFLRTGTSSGHLAPTGILAGTFHPSFGLLPGKKPPLIRVHSSIREAPGLISHLLMVEVKNNRVRRAL